LAGDLNFSQFTNFGQGKLTCFTPQASNLLSMHHQWRCCRAWVQSCSTRMEMLSKFF